MAGAARTARPAGTAGGAFCGIDVGTQGVRVVLLDASGRRLAAGSEPIVSTVVAAGRHEQSPETWWAALVAALRTALDQAGDVDVEAVALDATSGTVLVQKQDGSARGPALMYDDSRAVGQAQRARDAGAPLWRALGYRLQPTWALPKVMWLLEEGAAHNGDRIVHQADYLTGRLAGMRVATDTSHALKTGVDLRNGSWPLELFSALGISAEVLPELVKPGTTLGAVGARGAEETGLRQGTPIMAGMTDGCAAQIAAAALTPGRWSSALGTTLVVKGCTTSLVRDPVGAVYSHRHPDGGWLPGGASSTGAGVIRHTFPQLDETGLRLLTEGAAGCVLPPSEVTYPLVGQGERFPFVAPEAHGFGPSEEANPADRFVALCLGVAYVERLAYDVLGSLGADVDGPVSLTGGGARNAWWNQLRTDVLARPTLVPAHADSATGMAILAAAPEGQLTATAERMVQVSSRREPDPVRGAALRPGYERLVEELVGRGWLPQDAATKALTRGVAA